MSDFLTKRNYAKPSSKLPTFGMLMPNRAIDAEKYRFGFNDKENDNELKGIGNQQDYGMRIYDNRIDRFFSVDPLTSKYSELTPFQFASNTPIIAIDVDGLESSADFSAINKAAQESAEKADDSKVNFVGRYIKYAATNFLNTITGGALDDLNNGASKTANGSIEYLNGSNQSSQYNNYVPNQTRQVLNTQEKAQGLQQTSEGIQQMGLGVAKIGITAASLINPAAEGEGLLFNSGANSGFKGGSFAEKLFLSEKFGITSEKFANSITGVKGTWNNQGGLLKMGWSTQSKYGGGMQLRIGFGSKVGNPNQAWKHLYLPKTFVPNSFANPSIQVKQSLFKLGL